MRTLKKLVELQSAAAGRPASRIESGAAALAKHLEKLVDQGSEPAPLHRRKGTMMKKPAKSSVEVSTSTYRSAHGAEPRGPGHWGFVMGKLDYSFVDELDAQGRPVVFFPTAPSGMFSSNIPFAMAKKFAVAEAQRRGLRLISVAS